MQVGRGVCHYCAPPWTCICSLIYLLWTLSLYQAFYPMASQAWASGRPHCSRGWEGFLGSVHEAGLLTNLCWNDLKLVLPASCLPGAWAREFTKAGCGP